MIYKCLTRADRGDDGSKEKEEGDSKRNGEVKKEDSVRRDG